MRGDADPKRWDRTSGDWNGGAKKDADLQTCPSRLLQAHPPTVVFYLLNPLGMILWRVVKVGARFWCKMQNANIPPMAKKPTLP
nr:hypothetical protein CFP56_05558 [Quercus suber]